jgi:6,7-dimethyl-8-ribityllumazine synthase
MAPKVFEPDSDSPPRGDFAIVVSRYNAAITDKLLAGAVATLVERGIAEKRIHVAYVPGAWEIPLAAARFAQSGQYAAVLCLGAVIRGETTHDQHINRSISAALCEMSVSTGVPVLFGVLTCKTVEQALQRSGGAKGNKGVECAEAALAMTGLL